MRRGFTRSGPSLAVTMVALLLSSAACVHLFQTQPSHYVQLAEALTSATLTEGVRVAPLKMTAFQFTDACRKATPIRRFELAPATLQMHTGGRYALETLGVVAVNAANIAVPGTPFVIEAEERRSPVIELHSSDPDVRNGVLRALAPGKFKVRIRTTCGMPYVESVLIGEVAE